MANQAQPKLHIVNLSRLLGKFEPVLDTDLVNENNPHGWTGAYQLKENQTGEPTRDQILNTAYAAMGDIKQFIEDHEQCKKDLLELREDALKVHKLLMASGMSTSDMSEGVQMLFHRFKQCLDIITNAAKIKPDRLAAFQADAREFVLRYIPAEKRDTIFGEHSQAPTVLESQVKPEGDVRTNPDSGN